MSLKKIAAGALIASFAVAGTASVASAHGKHRHFHGKRVVIVVGKPRGWQSCDYYYWKWQKTGSYAWKSAYKECTGQW